MFVLYLIREMKHRSVNKSMSTITGVQAFSYINKIGLNNLGFKKFGFPNLLFKICLEKIAYDIQCL